MLGIRKKIKYYENEICFSRNDILYLYTDGVTEATSAKQELFGEERLKQCLDANAEKDMKTLLECVRSEVKQFAGEAEQFDDITMAALKSFSLKREMELEINGENQKKFAAFIEEVFDGCRIEAKTKRQMLICFDEIFSNAIKYSDAVMYKVVCGVHKNTVFLRLSDDGTPYNPLEQETIDVTRPRESYSKGGYGLIIIKKMTDKQVYNYHNSRNILTLYKEVAFENA
jgi:sigma-B regulation protein RsbU (phosphoserine phosphatase)